MEEAGTSPIRMPEDPHLAPSRIRKLLLSFILIIAAFLRTYHITTTPPGLYPDEAINGNDALQAVRTNTYAQFYPENNGREGLYINLQGVAMKITGVYNEPWVLRIGSAVFGILTVLGVYLVTAELLPGAIALLAAFFMATGFWHVMFSRIGFSAISSPFWLVWSVYFLLAAYRMIRAGKPRFLAAGVSALGGVCLGLGFNSYIAYRLAPALPFVIILYFFFAAKKERWIKAFIGATLSYVVLSIISLVPLASYYFMNPGSFSQRSSQLSILTGDRPLAEFLINTGKTIQMLFLYGDLNWRHNYSGHALLFWPVAVAFAAGVIIGIGYLLKQAVHIMRERRGTRAIPVPEAGSTAWIAYLILGVWFVIGMLPHALSNEGIPHALRSIMMTPPVYIIAGAGAWSGYQLLKKYVRSFLPPFFAGLFFVALTFQAYFTYFIAWGQNPNTINAFSVDNVVMGRQIDQAIAKQGTSVPIYVIVPDTNGHDRNDLPIYAQTVMFITDTYNAQRRNERNVHYVIEGHEGTIPANAMVFRIP
jgi:4-amino-4-deoxy-L-arabinose transferase-like glycosyltransferase